MCKQLYIQKDQLLDIMHISKRCTVTDSRIEKLKKVFEIGDFKVILWLLYSTVLKRKKYSLKTILSLPQDGTTEHSCVNPDHKHDNTSPSKLFSHNGHLYFTVKYVFYILHCFFFFMKQRTQNNHCTYILKMFQRTLRFVSY